MHHERGQNERAVRSSPHARPAQPQRNLDWRGGSCGAAGRRRTRSSYRVLRHGSSSSQMNEVDLAAAIHPTEKAS